MWTNYLSLTLLLLLCVSCSSKRDAVTGGPASPADRYIESVNTVSGSFSVDAALSEDKKPFTISPTQAYTRVIRNAEDQSKKDAFIILVEKPLSRSALAVAENDDTEEVTRDLAEILQNRDARGLAFRLPLDQQGAGPNVRAYFSGHDAHLGNLTVQINSQSADKIEGQVKSDVDSQQSDVSFSVRLLPDLWSGGTYYQQPPTNLQPGQASGQVEFDGVTLKFNHAYARLVDYDMFDETRNVFKVWFTEKPVDANALQNDTETELLAMKQSGNSLVLTYTTAGPTDRDDPTAWLVADVREGMDAQQQSAVLARTPGMEREYVRCDRDAIEGRLYTTLEINNIRHVYKAELLFNATMLPPTASEGPVTASTGGTALPADGGEPAKAYLAAGERMKAAKDVDQKLAVWLSVVPAAEAEKIKRDLDKLTPEARGLLIDVFAPLDDLRLVGGFIQGNKATLRFSGTGREGKATEVVNMHLENGQWKIGRREIREE
jgi:hypothetical protein